MYLGECFVKIPYYEYTLALRHASIRKLTVMEWSLLRIVDDYSARKDYKEYTLAHFYEEILPTAYAAFHSEYLEAEAKSSRISSPSYRLHIR